MNTLTVLLIIGSAVVGPIEAQPVPDRGCVGKAGPGACLTARESLPELCERAMRETLGVKQFIKPGEGYAEMGSDNTVRRMGFLGPNEHGGYYPPDNKVADLVRCIPVPAGYKR